MNNKHTYIVNSAVKTSICTEHEMQSAFLLFLWLEINKLNCNNIKKPHQAMVLHKVIPYAKHPHNSATYAFFANENNNQ